MADVREFLVLLTGRESVSPAAGKAENALGDLGGQAKKTERDFDGLDRKMRGHVETIARLREEVAKTGDAGLFKELGRNERALGGLTKLRKSFEDEGGPAATGFMASFSGRIGPLIARLPIGAPLAAVLGGAAIVAAPALGAVVASAILGGAGVGGVIGGAILASKDPRVKGAFTAMSTDMGKRLEKAAAPFVPAMVEAIGAAGSKFDALEGTITRVFARSATYVKPLTEGILGGAEAAVGGLADAVDGAAPVIQVLGNGLRDLGETAGGMFSLLADDGPAAADALNQTFSALNTTLTASAHVINSLTSAYDFLRENQGIVGDWLNPYIDKEKAAADAAKKNAEALREQGTAAYSTAQMTNLLTAALDRQVEGNLSAWEANLRYTESIDRARKAADKKKGVTSEEAGALADLARSTNTATRANDGNAESVDVARKRHNDARSAFIATAEKMGYSASKARELANQMLKIPEKVAAEIVVPTGPALAGVRNIQRAINGLRGRTIRNVIVTGELGGNDIGAMHGMSEGGEVGGGGPPGKDTQVRVLASDEFVLTGKQVREAGGADALRASLSGGGAPAAMGGAGGQGGTGGTESLTITIAWPDGSVAGRIVANGFAGPGGRAALSGLKSAIGNAGGNTSALAY
jgi:hypothetical protein